MNVQLLLKLWLFEIAGVLSAGKNRAAVEDLGDLVFVTAVFRHGDRSPIMSYPKDPHNNASLWPNGWGQLSDVGKRQAYELGKWFRNTYDGFLPARYHFRDIAMESTNVDRTLMSASCLLAGLYEPEEQNNWHPTIGWSPIPVHTTSENVDRVLAASETCPRYDNLFKEAITSDLGLKDFKKRQKSLLQEVSEYTGRRYQDVLQLLDVYATLFVEETNGLPLPDWTKRFYPEPLKTIAVASFKSITQTPTLKRLKCGLLVKHILELLIQKKNGILSQKVWLFSAHDSTLINLMRCMDVYDDSLPNYCSMIIFEMYCKQSSCQVLLSFKDFEGTRRLTLQNCGSVCSLEKFQELLLPVIPENWDDECKVP